MSLGLNAETVAAVSAGASIIYALISAISLWLLSQQIRDARRFGAAPALYALLKEMDDHMAAVRRLGARGLEDEAARETIHLCLEFFERIEHLRSAGVIPDPVLRRAFGNALQGYLGDPRFVEIMRQDRENYDEVLALAKHICKGGAQLI